MARLEPWPPDEGAVEIPDPRLTLSEAINVEGVVRRHIQRSTEKGDAVLENACAKLIESCQDAAEEFPEEFQAVVEEVDMASRFQV